ncbi:MAG: hypothetical protein MZU95_12980 [Desulfomicrobium escambiense]|nr:hypothetical protein [Desulfomicrobium escambiense]
MTPQNAAPPDPPAGRRWPSSCSSCPGRSSRSATPWRSLGGGPARLRRLRPLRGRRTFASPCPGSGWASTSTCASTTSASFILLALAGFLFLITALLDGQDDRTPPRRASITAYVFLTAALANGAVLANNFVPLVFFWEGLLVTLYAPDHDRRPGRPRTGPRSRPSSSAASATSAMILGIGHPLDRRPAP